MTKKSDNPTYQRLMNNLKTLEAKKSIKNKMIQFQVINEQFFLVTTNFKHSYA